MKRGLIALSVVLAALVCIAAVRSPAWRDVRNAAVQATPYCQLCGSEKELEAHHIKPFHIAPALELEPSNVCILCRHCHFQLGHGGISWSFENTNITVILKYEAGKQLYQQRKEYKEAR